MNKENETVTGQSCSTTAEKSSCSVAAEEQTATCSSSTTSDEVLYQRVEEIVDKLRPYIQSHGGDVKLAYIKDHVVYLELLGACGSCPSSTITLKAGIERSIQDEIPEIKEVCQV